MTKNTISIESLVKKERKISIESLQQSIEAESKIESVRHDWPHVRGPNMNGFTDVSSGSGSCMVVFVSTDNHVYAYNLNGNQLCSTRIEEGFNRMNELYAPAVVDDTIYISAEDARIYTLDFNGKIKWGKKIGSYHNPSSPVIKKNIMAFSEFHNAYMTDLNGDLIWKSDGKASWSIPAVILDDLILFAGVHSDQNYLLALDYDGEEKWRFGGFPLKINDCPVVDNDTIYIATNSNGLYALDLAGRIKWNFKIPDLSEAKLSPPAIKGERLFLNYNRIFGDFKRNCGVIAIDKKGRLLWQDRLYRMEGRQSRFAPTIYKNTVLIPSYTKIFAYDLDGNLLWGKGVAGGHVSSLSVTEGFAVFHNGCGQIISIDPDTVESTIRYSKNPLYLLIQKAANKTIKIPKEQWRFDQYSSGYKQSMPVIVKYDKK